MLFADLSHQPSAAQQRESGSRVPPSRPASVTDVILALQRSAGNRAVSALLARQAAETSEPVPKEQGAAVDHYLIEIKAWIPLAQVSDPEEPLQEAAFRLSHLGDDVSDYHSQYRGDAHAGYAGSFRVLHQVEFDWDGTALTNLKFPAIQHFGTTHREFSALVKPLGGFGGPQPVSGDESRTVDHSVSQSKPNPNEVAMGMASPNPLTLFPAPDIDADYTLFISRDFGEDTITVRWTTDLMPNHGFRIAKNGVDIKERIVNSLPGAPSSPEIFVRLNSKTNGGADSVTTVPGP